MKFNSPRQTLIVWVIITVLALLGIFAPRILGIDNQRWAVTFSDICFYIALIGIPVIIVYMGRARIVSTMLQGKNLLAHWEYTPQEWVDYTEYQWAMEKKEKKLLFYIITGFVVIVGGLFIFMTQENWFIVVIVVLAIISISGFISWFTVWNYHRENKKYPGETYITENAVYIGRRLHLWKGLGSKLESIQLIHKNDKYMLAIYYNSPVRYGLQNYPVTIPVHGDKVKEVKLLLDKLGFDHKVNPDK